MNVAATSFAEALRYLAQVPDFERGGLPASALSLDRFRALLGALGRPDRQYPSVLIAGTKGKGSTAAMVERALRAANYRTGLYTQPHLHTIRERVRIDGEPIREEAFARELEALRPTVEGIASLPGSATAYEVMTALALQHFAQQRVDIAVLEVGLGGRLDATNAVEAAVSVLTPISLDHTQVLGDTVAAIASEKADIIKAGRPCVSAPQPPEAMAVIREVARNRDAPLVIAEEDEVRWEAGAAGSWELCTGWGHLQDVQLALRGGFQRVNAAVAATVLEALDRCGVARMSPAALRAGLERVSWPGRFEVVPGDPPLVLDGAHNVASASRLREALAEQWPLRQPLFVLGIAVDKDIPGIVGALCAPAVPGSGFRVPGPERRIAPGDSRLETRNRAIVIATGAAHPRAAPPEAIAQAAHAVGAHTLLAPTVAAALRAARDRASSTSIIVVTGSLHLVGEAREALGLAEPSGERSYLLGTAPQRGTVAP